MTVPLEIEEIAHDACRRAIIVSGTGRTGTTILGTILHSMEGVEYAFEPPILCALLPLIDTIPKSEWKLLYATYLYEEFLINAVSGRALNCNRDDVSSIYRAKGTSFVEDRLSRSIGKMQAVERAHISRPVYKLPDIIPYLPRLCEYYPGTRVVLLHRNANDTLNSVVKKRWFDDETLRTGLLMWPNRVVNGIRIPHWVAEEDIGSWVEADELHRAAYYYLRGVKPAAQVPNRIVVRYDDLVQDPAAVVARLALTLGLSYGEKTVELIRTIKKTEVPREDLVQRLAPALREEVAQWSLVP